MSSNDQYRSVLNDAIEALHKRSFYALYPEHPSANVYGEDADKEGRKKFEESLNKKFDELYQPDPEDWTGSEESPYFQQKLGIKYPSFSPATLIERAVNAFEDWRNVPVDDRAVFLIDSLERIQKRFFEIAYATMHTTGQGYMMAFQASGPHAADRALEAIASGYEELSRFPEKTLWDKPMGKYNIKLNKEWRAVPKGLGLVVGCSTFPTWNSVPGLYASLVTGNSVIVKPHPGAVLPMAIVVAEIQNAIKDAGFNPLAVQLAADTHDNMITKELAEDPEVKLIDYTGSSSFGDYLENLEGKTVFTEKTGVNSVILHSAEDINKVAQNLAFSVTLYSGQMCTAPQDIFVPDDGVETPDGKISFDEFARIFVDNINGLVDNPKAGPFVLGTIQNQQTCDRVKEAEKLPGKIWLKSRTIENPMFKNARISTPVVIEIDADKKEEFSKELFGPIVFLIRTKNVDQSIELAQQLAKEQGAISCGAYVTDHELKMKIADAMALAATPVSFNLIGNIYLNQHAGFSDFHVTGGNPAGNASFTNPEFVIKRFTWVGFREPVD